MGVKALLRSADLAPDEMQEEPSKFDKWLEKKLGSEAFQKAIVGIAVAMGLLLSIGLFFLLPMVIGGFFDKIITSTLLLNLVEGVIRMVIFMAYMILVSKMPRHEAGVFLPRRGTQDHPLLRGKTAPDGGKCTQNDPAAPPVRHQLPSGGHGESPFLCFPSRRRALLAIFPGLETIRGTFGYRMLMIVFKLLLLPVVVGITYEINRWCGRNDNAFTRALSAPGMWMQHFTTNEPDDSMIEVGIAAVQAVLPEKEGSDRW